ncbi:hypothetical protein ACQP2F_37260 [Actinoplanes sp. CA-030573]|uniref:hypothetical protein n=1 Tax=Actinoplanes sp. CA-030573 TaxID=3239898 RepID=UPI003D8EBEEA
MTAADMLSASGRFRIATGLTEDEIAATEAEFGFRFADDHRAFLAGGLPTGRGWPDWRGPDREALRTLLAEPVEGVLFDVAENDFWYEGWGPRPTSAGAALATARGYLMTVPRMIPLYAHRFLPAATTGHPVLSIYQTDVVQYGNDISDWLNREFALGSPAAVAKRPTVPFWRDLV